MLAAFYPINIYVRNVSVHRHDAPSGCDISALHPIPLSLYMYISLSSNTCRRPLALIKNVACSWLLIKVVSFNVLLETSLGKSFLIRIYSDLSDRWTREMNSKYLAFNTTWYAMDINVNTLQLWLYSYFCFLIRDSMWASVTVHYSSVSSCVSSVRTSTGCSVLYISIQRETIHIFGF